MTTIPSFSKCENLLFERILSFDFYKDLVLDSQDNYQIIRRRIKWHLPLQRLPAIINSEEDYYNSFFPLFMVECLQMLTKSKYSDMSNPSAVELLSCQISGLFGLLLFSIPDTATVYSVGDVVLLYIKEKGDEVAKKKGNVTNTKEQTNVDIFIDCLQHGLGIVESVFKNRILIKVLLLPPSFVSTETCTERDLDRLYALQQTIQTLLLKKNINSNEIVFVKSEFIHECFMCRLTSITTVLREFRSLTMFTCIPLKQCLLGTYKELKNEQNTTVNMDNVLSEFNIPNKLKNTIKSTYNMGQLQAIANCLRKSNGITLIQGPPGTGKTTAIIGIISVVLNLGNAFKSEHEPSKNQNSMDFDTARDSDWSVRNPWFSNKINETQLKDYINVPFECLYVESSNLLSSNRTLDIYQNFAPTKNKFSTDCIYISAHSKRFRRVLICAPSNAAIDEIVKRLVRQNGGGIFDANGQRYNPVVTRVGPNIHEDLLEYSLEKKLARWLSKKSAKESQGSTVNKSSIQMEIILNSDIVCSTLSSCGSNELFSCLSYFDTLIVDEATQSVELSSLIALSAGCKRAILVGDPCQLSATVCSRAAIQLNYDQSLFQRLQLCGYPVNLLNTQYRMHPRISSFPSMYFYQNKLLDAPFLLENVADKGPSYSDFPLLQSTVFYAIDSQEMRNETSYVNEKEVELVCQLLEILCEVILSVPGNTMEHLVQQVAVISPYSAQVELLKNSVNERIRSFIGVNEHLISHNNHVKRLQIDISTVDGFQGMEKDIVIFSAVRTNYVGSRKALNANIRDLTASDILTIDEEPHDLQKLLEFQKSREKYLREIKSWDENVIKNIVDVSFISDRRRINVAITRACNPRYLLDHAHWNALYNHYAKCGYIFLCKIGNNELSPNYLVEWSRNYLRKSPENYKRFINHPYFKRFVSKIFT